VSRTEDSPRVAVARVRAEQRLDRQRGTIRPLGWAVIVVVAAGTFSTDAHAGAWVVIALVAFAAAVAFAIRDPFTRLGEPLQAAVIALMAAAGVALGALQPRGASGLATGAAVWMAVARLPLPAGLAIGSSATVALDLALALSGSSAANVSATTLLCALMALIAHFIRQARLGQDRTELLLAQLEDAREEQTRAAAIAERGRIAGELHDVLAHSLSGAAIQLQGARKLADRERAEPQLSAAIDRAGELVKDGLLNARQAVGALRGEALPSVEQLEALVESYRRDMRLSVSLRVEGSAKQLPADASLALYRGAQEALTNVARYAPGARIDVVLSYEPARTLLSVENRLDPDARVPDGLTGVGGGRGLDGMRERIERAGGAMLAGPTEHGWRVELEVPA
jgi:signal transduction histidine kinase